MNQIKIIATIGPATKETNTITDLIKNGLSIARLNFSWGSHEDHRGLIENIRTAAKTTNQTIPIIQDLSGPRVQQGTDHTFNSQQKAITEKDQADLKAITDLKPEFIALSFIKDATDITELRTDLKATNPQAKIIAKIERQEALNNLDDIITAADAIMIARGDLGDAVPVETLPFIKKDILKRCTGQGKPAIVATDMLTSMTENLKPSRADVSDIAHAVLDGASATMLSNETAIGKNPVASVALMRKVVDEAQKHTTTEPPEL